MRAAPGSPRGRSTAAPAPRPAAVLSRAPLAPLPGAASPAPRLPLGLSPPLGAAASLPPAARPRHRCAPPAPGSRARRERRRQAGGRPGGRAPKGRPRGWRARAVAVPALPAGRRPAPRPRSSRAAGSTLARSRTQTAFSCQRIALEPPRLLRKKKKKGNNSPAVSGAAPSPSSAPGVRSRPGKGRARRGAPGPHPRYPCAPRVPSARARIPYF